MQKDKIDKFIEKVKKESQYKKFINTDIIYLLFDSFKCNNKVDYSHKIDNPLEIVLNFYKDYNKEYYEMILKGINEKRIVIGNNESHVDTNNNSAYIKLCNNDSDIFIIAHELAHYIDRNSNPQIVPDKYWFLSEAFSFYIEKKLENWLNQKGYGELIEARQNNRLYFESQMMEAVKIELKYEEMYKQKGTIQREEIELSDLEVLKKYNYNNLINYLLQYPIANIISDYLTKKENVIAADFVNECLKVDLYDLLESKINKTH